MALTIRENKGIFELHGSLNSTTTGSFMTHFEYLIKTAKDVTVNIDNIKAIDASGVDALKTLMAMASSTNRFFFVIGNGCKDIYDEYKASFAA